ncbi:MAG: transposase [Patescibacteria group bacterium]|nr:transposase [Patescibacteria group bacterium]
MSSPNAVSFTRALRLKVKREAYPWLNQAAMEVNGIWNYCNETSIKAVQTGTERPQPKWLSGFDLCYLTAGMTEFTDKIGADSIQMVCIEYANKRRVARKRKLRWRISWGAKRSLGWVPFKAASLKQHGNALRFCGKTFRVFEAPRLPGVQWGQGCFAQDAIGDWWLCLPVEARPEWNIAPKEAVGIHLGLKTIAATSDGDKLQATGFYRGTEVKLAQAQRRGHKRQAKRLHRRIARQRRDALHKFSRKVVNEYQNIVIGDVSSTKLAKTRMAKSVLDAGWGMLKTFLQYKGQQAGRSVSVVSERYTSRVCSQCGSLSGPQGLGQLSVRTWECKDCGAVHDRDVNAARNILTFGSRCQTSVSGNESSDSLVPSSAALKTSLREAWIETARMTA